MTDIHHHNGHVAELYVAYRLAALGYTIHWPMTAQSRYDVLVGIGDEFARVQIKKATWSKSGPYEYLQARIKSRNKGGSTYSSDEIDLFAFTDLTTVWLVRTEDLAGYTSVCLGSSNPAYKQQTKYDASQWIV